MVVEIDDRDVNIVSIQALIDTGTTYSIVLREFVGKGRTDSYIRKTTYSQHTL